MPAPNADPPYDDELGQLRLVPPGQGTLPFEDSALAGITPPANHSLSAVQPQFAGGRIGPGVALRLLPGGRSRTREVPPPSEIAPARLRHQAHMLVVALAEVLSGIRPAGQLTGTVSAGVLRALQTGGRWQSTAGRPGLRPAVRSVHVSQPAPHIAEVCAVVRRGGRCHALALRMRWRKGRWETTTVQVG